MWKKRKHSETQTAEPTKNDEGAPERPKRTLSDWKDKEEAEEQTESKTESSPVFRNKEKVMVTCSFRINCKLVESRSSKGATLKELIELRGCSSSLFFECRKHQDLYTWMSKSPNGPSVKFFVNAGNFEKDVHWKLLKGMIIQISVPHNESYKIGLRGT
ncbi:hypothetical protein GQ457_07G014420 [Hibiscus cannabinus]